VTLLGGNGSGKSTLVRALLGLTPHQRGSVRLFGSELGRFSDWRRVGYVPQRSSAALSNALVREVVAAGRLSHRRPFVPPRRTDRTAVGEALATVGMADRAGDELRRLSGGQQQRVLIARALAGAPDLLVLDEPNAGVDLEHQQVLAEVLSALIGRGVAVLVVLHEVGPLAGLIDRAVVLREGRIVHDGPLGLLGQGHHHHGHHADGPGRSVRDRALLDGPLLSPTSVDGAS
jgi:zinc transport system ATP-binding protein